MCACVHASVCVCACACACVCVCVAQATLDTVEAIVVWRDGLTRPAPFLWQGENYLQVQPILGAQWECRKKGAESRAMRADQLLPARFLWQRV